MRAPNWTGDVVMATPGFRALRAAFPGARITLLMRPAIAPLLAGNPWFDEILPVHSHGGRPLSMLREGLALRGRRFDLGLCLPDSFSAALHLRLAGVACVVGYAGRGRGPLLHRRVEPPWGTHSRALVARERHVLGLVEAVGAPALGTQLELFVTPEEERLAERFLAQASRAEAPLAAIAPGASYGPSKLWPAESFAKVGDALSDAGAQVIVLGAPSEAALIARVRASMHRPALELTAPGSLGLLKAVLRRARVLVCNDAGARHVAVAFGVPCVVLFGPTSLEKTNLNLSGVQALAADVPCRPCYQRTCPIDHRCMTRIGAERVIAAALPAVAVGR
ncbi:MAG TPA: lipopolysaccharide heptosyltransferase II [Myxococcota bacterium]|nr:lipopolysaccharide heptosyltransferase II [Myxococcota bacterium]